MSSGVSDLGTRLSREYALGVLRNNLTETQRQSSSGKKSDGIDGLGTLGAGHAVTYRASVKLLDTYTENLNLSKTRFSVMDKSMGVTNGLGNDILTQLRSQLQDTPPQATILRTFARDQLTQLQNQINTQIDNTYVFGGDASDTKPLDNPGALNASMAGLVAGWMAGGVTADGVVTAARGKAGTDLGLNNATVNANLTTFRGGDETNVTYTAKADQQGFSDMLRGMAIIANLPQPTTPAEQTNYWSIVNGAIKLIDGGTKSVNEAQGLLGNQAKTVENLLVQHSESNATFEQYIGDVEDVDMAQTAMKFQNLTTQLQTSYSIISATKDLSLVNFL